MFNVIHIETMDIYTVFAVYRNQFLIYGDEWLWVYNGFYRPIDNSQKLS